MRLVLSRRTVAAVFAGAFALLAFSVIDPAWSGEGGKKHDGEQGEGKGKGKGKGHEAKSDRGPDKADRRDGKGRDEARRVEPAHAVTSGRRVFEDRQRVVIHEYYVTEHRHGRCPPGLAKKNNGCMPPGQAKKWRVGHPLPREVIFYDLPPALIVQIGAPPPGHRYVRVAADILLIAIGTGMVVDAIGDLGRL